MTRHPQQRTGHQREQQKYIKSVVGGIHVANTQSSSPAAGNSLPRINANGPRQPTHLISSLPSDNAEQLTDVRQDIAITSVSDESASINLQCEVMTNVTRDMPFGRCLGKMISETLTEPVRTQVACDKRIAIFLNASPTQAETIVLHDRIKTPMVHERFGAIGETTYSLTAIKVSIRKVVVRWVHGAVGGKRLQNPSWISQVC